MATEVGLVANLREWCVERNWGKVGVGLKAIAVGQILSLLVTCTGLASAVLVRNGINAPATQNFLFYLLISAVYGPKLVFRRKKIRIAWYWYLLLTVVDVEANYLTVKAYQYTSITSAMLLDCWIIPCVLALTWLVLKTRYGVHHFAGVAICVGGLIMVVFSDVHVHDRASSGSYPILGDALILVAAALFAVVNVGEEYAVKKVDMVEYLAHLGLFGAIISGYQVSTMELQQLQAVDWSLASMAPFLAFGVSCFGFASLAPWLLQMSGAMMLSLSLLTSDMWAVAIRARGFHEVVDSLYFVAFALVAVGLVVYASNGEPSHFLEDNLEEKYSLINEQVEQLFEP